MAPFLDFRDLVIGHKVIDDATHQIGILMRSEGEKLRSFGGCGNCSEGEGEVFRNGNRHNLRINSNPDLASWSHSSIQQLWDTLEFFIVLARNPSFLKYSGIHYYGQVGAGNGFIPDFDCFRDCGHCPSRVLGRFQLGIKFPSAGFHIVLDRHQRPMRDEYINSGEHNIYPRENGHYPFAMRKPMLRWLLGTILLIIGFCGGMWCASLYLRRRVISAVCVFLGGVFAGTLGLGMILSVG